MLKEARLSVKDADYYYLHTTTSEEPTRYGSLAEAASALDALIALQEGRQYKTERNPSGRYMSKRQKNPTVMFWIENEGGAVVS